MLQWFHGGGVMMWPLLLIGIGVLFLAARAMLLLRRGPAAATDAEGPLRAILFWGVMSLVLGTLGTTVGIVQMAEYVSRAGGAQASTLWGGIGVALITLIFGTLIFLVAALAWFLLRQRLERLDRPSLA